MKANELMIGDWVRIKITQHNTTVTNIDANSVYTEAAFPIRYDEIEPIHITPEILEKNGFKKDEKLEKMYYWNWGIIDDCVSYNKETGIVRIFHVFGHLVFVLPLSYVHQLQHALRLCGIDKTIEL